MFSTHYIFSGYLVSIIVVEDTIFASQLKLRLKE